MGEGNSKSTAESETADATITGNEDARKPSRSRSSKELRARREDSRRELKRLNERQLVTTPELERLSQDIKLSSSNLGRRLDLTRSQVRRITATHHTEVERKLQTLMLWQKLQGKDGGTVQRTVIALQSAGCEFDEYQSLVRSRVGATDQPVPSQRRRPPDRYDVTDGAMFEVEVAAGATARRILDVVDDPTTDGDDVDDDVMLTASSQCSACEQLGNSTKTGDFPTKRCVVHRHKEPDAARDHVPELEVDDDDVAQDLDAKSLYRFSDNSESGSDVAHRSAAAAAKMNRNRQQVQTREKCDQLNRLFAEDDDDNHRCFVFGSKGKKKGHFQGLIAGVAIATDDDIVVSDSDNKRIQTFDRFGRLRSVFDTWSSLKPRSVHVTSDGDIVACCGTEIRVFSREGELSRSFGHGTSRNNCYGVCSDRDGNLYVSDIVANNISVHDSLGNVWRRFGVTGSKLSCFNRPVALAISAQQELYVSDNQNDKIKVCTLTGRVVRGIGGSGSEDGQLMRPFGICFDRSGYLYVADRDNDRVSVFTQDGKFVFHALTSSAVRQPCWIQINSRDQMVVSEWDTQRVKVFDLEAQRAIHV